LIDQQGKTNYYTMLFVFVEYEAPELVIAPFIAPLIKEEAVVAPPVVSV